MKCLILILAVGAPILMSKPAFADEGDQVCRMFADKMGTPKSETQTKLFGEMNRDCTRLLADHEAVKAATYPGCDRRKSPGECYKIYLSKNPPRTAFVTNLMLVVGMAAVLREADGQAPKKICGKQLCDYGLIDVQLKTFELTAIADFAVSKMKPITADDIYVQEKLLEQDRNLLAKVRKVSLKQANKSLANIYSQLPRCPAAGKCSPAQQAANKEYSSLLKRYNSIANLERTVASTK